MLTAEQNALLTRTGPGTPGGAFMRSYWQPAALSSELGIDPIPVRLLSEDFVLFRNERGEPAMLDVKCPHRGADLSYGRIENGALRCIYHGWLFGKDGTCLEQPGEPAGSTYANRVKTGGYPAVDVNGVILAYLGPGEPPPLPDFPFLLGPPEWSFATKLYHECNYLQGNEGNADPQHLSYLHRNFAAEGGSRESHALVSRDVAPRIDVEETPYGLRIYASRDVGEGEQYVRVSNIIMPNGSAFPAGLVVDPAVERLDGNTHYSMHFHVPIDDAHHWKYRILVRINGPVDQAYLAQQNESTGELPFERERASRNRYLQDRDEQRRRTFTGMGTDFQDHDRYAVESQGPIFDRSHEHLATTDKAIIAMRKQMIEAIEVVQAGGRPLMTDPREPRPCRDLVVRSMRIPAGEDPRIVVETVATGTAVSS
jgi:phthalate 4,5-dioxygenase oxygenase subunit